MFLIRKVAQENSALRQNSNMGESQEVLGVKSSAKNSV